MIRPKRGTGARLRAFLRDIRAAIPFREGVNRDKALPGLHLETPPPQFAAPHRAPQSSSRQNCGPHWNQGQPNAESVKCRPSKLVSRPYFGLVRMVSFGSSTILLIPAGADK